MGIWQWFSGRQSATDKLLTSLLDLEGKRLNRDIELEKLHHELKLKTTQLEIENIERISEEKRKDADARLVLRQQKRESAQRMREIKAHKTSAHMNGHSGLQGCRVCANGSDPSLTAHEIQWHSAGHPNAVH